ncbi:sigma-70, region 4 [Clostridium puniceum]|uniref:Sigma-70, region 4 n=1 Tax=Clostridium puniceum TaxID=29367 RepID=A0A1S8TX98_9CLOT|nr:sigma factor-like helix-turn-helix DNA-binding protein [Clostridium puniceum]OOM82310.1 sigma-70, region 4 [Clostridium puniceum]
MKGNNNYRIIESKLYNYKSTQALVENLDLKLAEMKYDINGAGAVSYEERTGKTNKFNSSVENEAIIREKKMFELTYEIMKIKNELAIIDNSIDSLLPREKQIIYERYFNKTSGRNIAAKLNLTEVHVCRLKKDIINKLIPMILN